MRPKILGTIVDDGLLISLAQAIQHLRRAVAPDVVLTIESIPELARRNDFTDVVALVIDQVAREPSGQAPACATDAWLASLCQRYLHLAVVVVSNTAHFRPLKLGNRSVQQVPITTEDEAPFEIALRLANVLDSEFPHRLVSALPRSLDAYCRWYVAVEVTHAWREMRGPDPSVFEAPSVRDALRAAGVRRPQDLCDVVELWLIIRRAEVDRKPPVIAANEIGISSKTVRDAFVRRLGRDADAQMLGGGSKDIESKLHQLLKGGAR